MTRTSDNLGSEEQVENLDDIKKTDKDGRNILHRFAILNDHKNAKVLFEKIPKEDLQNFLSTVDYYENTVLTLACQGNTKKAKKRIKFLKVIFEYAEDNSKLTKSKFG